MINMEEALPPINYAGPEGGFLAMAFGAGWALASALWIAVGGVIWRYFIEPRIKGIEADRERDQERCREETNKLNDRIVQLETMLMLHGPQQLRQAMQAIASESHSDIRELKATIEEAKR